MQGVFISGVTLLWARLHFWDRVDFWVFFIFEVVLILGPSLFLRYLRFWIHLPFWGNFNPDSLELSSKIIYFHHTDEVLAMSYNDWGRHTTFNQSEADKLRYCALCLSLVRASFVG